MIDRLGPPLVHKCCGRKAIEQSNSGLFVFFVEQNDRLALQPLSQLGWPNLQIALERLGRDHTVEHSNQLWRTRCAYSRFQDLKPLVPSVPFLYQRLRVLSRRQDHTRCVFCCGPETLQILQELIRIGTHRFERAQLAQWNGIEPFTPIVLHGTQTQLVTVFHPALLEQAGTVKRMGLEHATAPAMDCEDGGIVHPLRGHIQAVGTLRPLFWRKLGSEIAQEIIRIAGTRFSIFEIACSLGQALTNTSSQFGRCGISKGHDQNLWRVQRCRIRRSISAMAQNQANVEGSQGPGLTRTGRRFNDVQTVEGHRQRVELFYHAVAPSCTCKLAWDTIAL